VSGAVDVLADLRGVVRIAKAASIGVTGNAARIERAEKAIAALDQLIVAATAAKSTLSTGEAFVRVMKMQGAGMPMAAQLSPEMSHAYRTLRDALAGVGGAAW
jgi:hypothetical protein